MEAAKNYFLSEVDVSKLVNEIVRNDVIQWVTSFIGCDVALQFPEIYVSQNIRQSVSEIELECDYRNNCVDIKIPHRKFTVDEDFIGLKFAMFHEIVSHSCQQARRWQKDEHEIFIDGMLFLAQLLFCMRKTEYADIRTCYEDAKLNYSLTGVYHSAHADIGLSGFPPLKTSARSGYYAGVEIIDMLNNLGFSWRRVFEVYINFCMMLLNGQPDTFAIDSKGCSCNFWMRFASGLSNIGSSGTVIPPDSWRNKTPEDLLTENSWRELIDFVEL
jgi:hypothetical protein